ncbi:MAG: glycosyltransferase [Tenericutes bacterium]|nr:glycosyltransferase [Mycoplasmatota bacterium]
MNKLVQINIVCNGSTGRIMCDIAKKAEKEGFQSYIFYGRGNPSKELNCTRIGNNLSVYFHVFLTRFFNKHGHGSYFATKKLVRELKKITPDIIHLHNIHGYYINLKILFNYLKYEYKGKIIWTLHDCWSFTGHCTHFTIVECNKWQGKCYKCPQVTTYPKAFLIDTSKKEFQTKKKLFTGLNNLTIITPSKWLADLVKKSFLNEYKIEVINNGVDLNIFKPTCDERIYKKYNIPKNKKIILGVANIWGERKGLNDFIELSKIINNEYKIVLVGVNAVDKKKIPANIICVNRTDNAIELAKFYSAAYCYVNPTYEDNYPTTNIEAISCGTYVISYDTGGCKEQITNNNGLIIQNRNEKSLAKAIYNFKKTKVKSPNFTIFSKEKKYDEYIKLYSMK